MTEGTGAPLIYRSHGAIAPFRLHRPTSVAEAVSARAAAGPDAAFLAGGVDLVPAMRRGTAPGDVVHLGGIAELTRIDRTEEGLVLGGGITYRQIETDPTLADALPDLAAAWHQVANIRVRLAGTLGGNLMAGNPTYDALPALAALGARLRFVGDGGETTIDLGAEPLPTLPPSGLMVDATIPLDPAPRLYVERAYKPVAAVFVVRRQDRVRVAVACAHGAVVAASGAVADGAAAIQAKLPSTITDPWAGADYRARLVDVLIGRGLDALGDG